MFEKIPKTCRYAYARVSSKSQEENSSLETQKQEFIQNNRIKRKRRPKREPITMDIYNFLISHTKTIGYKDRYRTV